MRPPFPLPHAFAVSSKVCGLTRLEDAVACAEAGINAIGINFWPKSKRYHPLEKAAAWLDNVPETLTRVALFVNAAASEVDEIMGSGLLDAAQFHGDETNDEIRRHLDKGYACIHAMSARQEADLEKISSSPCGIILLDAWQPGVYGGSGIRCDWNLAARAVVEFPQKQIILSGGLHPDNVARAIREVNPAGIDLASGVEIIAGVKDHNLVRRLGEALHYTLQ